MSYLYWAQIIISAVLILVLLFQVKGGGLGGIFGQPDSVFRTRRGIERTLFQVTIVLAVIFLALSLLSVKLQP